MQREINNEVHLGQMVTPFESISKSSAIDKIALDFDSPKEEKIKKAYKNRSILCRCCALHTRNARCDFSGNDPKNFYD